MTLGNAPHATGDRAHTSRLLIVEDDVTLSMALRDGLRPHGFTVETVANVDAAWEALWASHFDLLLFDVMLADGEDAGFEFAKQVRDAGMQQPIMFLTARETLEDRLTGLADGDDYLAKPFALSELIARLRALRRRGEVLPRRLTWNAITLDVRDRSVTCDGEFVRLTGKEFAILELFMLNPGRVFTRDEVLERVWGPGFSCPSNMVSVYVKKLRAKVDVRVIDTVRGLGYRHPG